jgi:hypothetical protein
VVKWKRWSFQTCLGGWYQISLIWDSLEMVYHHVHTVSEHTGINRLFLHEPWLFLGFLCTLFKGVTACDCDPERGWILLNKRGFVGLSLNPTPLGTNQSSPVHHPW